MLTTPPHSLEERVELAYRWCALIEVVVDAEPSPTGLSPSNISELISSMANWTLSGGRR